MERPERAARKGGPEAARLRISGYRGGAGKPPRKPPRPEPGKRRLKVNALQRTFLDTIAPWAQAAQRKWAVPASVTMAQAILESSNEKGWGQSDLARECNNFFGIKAAHSAAPNTYKTFSTHEYVGGELVTVPAEFARYDSPAESFEAHARLLARARRYWPAMRVRTSPEAFAEELQLCGYSTNPNYGRSLATLIRLYDLTKYDVRPDGPAAVQEAA